MTEIGRIIHRRLRGPKRSVRFQLQPKRLPTRSMNGIYGRFQPHASRQVHGETLLKAALWSMLRSLTIRAIFGATDNMG